MPYRVITGLSRCSSRRRASIDALGMLGRARRSARGSPELATIRNTRNETAITTGIEISRRRITKPSIEQKYTGDSPPSSDAREGPAGAGPSHKARGWRVLALEAPSLGVPERAVRRRVVVHVGERVPEGDVGGLLVQRDRGHVGPQLRVD